MELGLSLGDASEILQNKQQQQKKKIDLKNGGLDFCMALGLGSYGVGNQGREKLTQKSQERDDVVEDEDDDNDGSDDDEEISPVQLNLLPLAPVNPRRINSSLPWSSDNGSSENGSSGNTAAATAAKGFWPPGTAAEEVSSANSVGSPLQMDFTMYRNITTVNGNSQCGSKRDFEAAGNDVVEAERASSRASDEDENALNTRKKLRLSKEQSAFLEESFKEHNTLNPKQKLALAKQLNLRPRQVEVWFQNRRARTKLKQTEVDCEYLKRCCETLAEENRRLQKELHELRALKASNPFYMQQPATTLTMCPSCERVAAGGAPPSAAGGVKGKRGGGVENNTPKGVPFPLIRPRFYPFSQTPTHHHQSAAS